VKIVTIVRIVHLRMVTYVNKNSFAIVMIMWNWCSYFAFTFERTKWLMFFFVIQFDMIPVKNLVGLVSKLNKKTIFQLKILQIKTLQSDLVFNVNVKRKKCLTFQPYHYLFFFFLACGGRLPCIRTIILKHFFLVL
jgi:hypothetical protein